MRNSGSTFAVEQLDLRTPTHLCDLEEVPRDVGREDDVISSAGYRIGPGEIEDCVLRHPAAQLAAAVAAPDAVRGSVVAVYLQLVPGTNPSVELEQDIAEFVKTRLAAHEYPRIVR